MALAVEEIRTRHFFHKGLELIRWDYRDYYVFQLAVHEMFDNEVRGFVMEVLGLTEADWKEKPSWAIHPAGIALLLRLAGSDLERSWLQYLEDRNLRLPAESQRLIERCKTRPDFLYNDHQAAIYIDGPHHDYPDRQRRDQGQTEAMEALEKLLAREKPKRSRTLAGKLPPPNDTAVAQARTGALRLRTSLDLKQIGGETSLGPLGTLLHDRERLELAGTFDVLASRVDEDAHRGDEGRQLLGDVFRRALRDAPHRRHHRGLSLLRAAGDG